MFSAEQFVTKVTTVEPKDAQEATRFGRKLTNVWLSDYLAQYVSGADTAVSEGYMRFYPVLWKQNTTIYRYTMVAEKEGRLRQAQICSIHGLDDFERVMKMVVDVANRFEDVAIGGPIGTGKVKEYLEEKIPHIKSCFYKQDKETFWFDNKTDSSFEPVWRSQREFSHYSDDIIPGARNLQKWLLHLHKTKSDKINIMVPTMVFERIPLPVVNWKDLIID
jgi:hypothetical protein